MIDDTGDFIKSFGGSPLVRGRGEKTSDQYDKPDLFFGACAGAAFYKTELFEKAGMFDEDFFAYLEDVDLSFRFQLSGFKCYYNPEIICYHKRGETTKNFYRMGNIFFGKICIAKTEKLSTVCISKVFSLFYIKSEKIY